MTSQKEIPHNEIEYEKLEKRHYNLERKKGSLNITVNKDYEPDGEEAFVFFRYNLSPAQERVISQPSICKLHFAVDRSCTENLDLALKTFLAVLSDYPTLVMDFKIVKDNDGTREGAEITCLIPSNSTFQSNDLAARCYLDFANDVARAFRAKNVRPASISKLDESINTYASYRIGHNGSHRDGGVDYAHDLAGTHLFSGCSYVSTFALEELHKKGLLKEKNLSNPDIYEISPSEISPRDRISIVSVSIPPDHNIGRNSPSMFIKSKSLPDSFKIARQTEGEDGSLASRHASLTPKRLRDLQENDRGHSRSFSK